MLPLVPPALVILIKVYLVPVILVILIKACLHPVANIPIKVYLGVESLRLQSCCHPKSGLRWVRAGRLIRALVSVLLRSIRVGASLRAGIQGIHCRQVRGTRIKGYRFSQGIRLTHCRLLQVTRIKVCRQLRCVLITNYRQRRVRNRRRHRQRNLRGKYYANRRAQ